MDKGAAHIDDDKRLVAKLLGGDQTAFEGFFTLYFPRLFRFALARTNGDKALAEDVAQRTLCDVMFKLDSFRGESSLFTWLCKICRNVLASEYRRHSTDPARHTVYEDSAPVRAALELLSNGVGQPEQDAQGRDIQRLVQLVLDYLPPKYATVLELKYIHGERIDAIAAQLEISPKAAESLIGRARKAFRDGFETLFGLDPAEELA